MKTERAPAHHFRWRGEGPHGPARGEVRGPSAAWVRATLRRKGIRDVRVSRSFGFAGAGARSVSTTRELSLFSRQLATMLGAGIPIASAMETLLLHCPRPAMRNMLRALCDEIESGAGLGTALAAWPRTFSPLYLALVRAGEVSGALDQVLARLGDNMEKSIAIRKKVRAAMLYPAVITLVAVAVTALMMGFVIPRFETLFAHYGAELPPLTRIVVGGARAFREYGGWGVLAVLALVVAAVVWRRCDARFRRLLDALLLRLPLFGAPARKAVLSRTAHTLAMMLGVGVPLLEAMPPLAAVAGNAVYRDAILQAASAIGGGRSLEASLRATGVFPPMLLQMIKTGEESGRLETMLHQAGGFMEAELDDAVAALGALLEPLVIVVLGALVGVIVVAMYLPVFRLASVF